MLINLITSKYLISILMILCLMRFIEGQKNETRQKFRVKKFKIDFNSRFRNTLFNKYEEIELPKEDDDEEEGRADDPQKLQNIDLILKGYDIFIGDPYNDVEDPGITKAKIFQMDEDGQSVTGDGRWYVPKNIDFNTIRTGAMTTQSTEVTGEKSYQESIGFSIENEGKIGTEEISAEFSASLNFKTVSESTYKNKEIIYTSSAITTIYSMEIKEKSFAQYDKIDPEFKNWISNLPLVASAEASDYMKRFVETYGTHYVKKAAMGARVFTATKISEESYTKLKSMGIDASIGGSLAVGELFKASSKIGADYNTTNSQAYQKLKQDVIKMFRGTPAPKDGDFDTWVKEAESNSPYPIHMTLKPITDLFNTYNFPNITAKDLKAKKLLLESFMVGDYCKVILAKKGCKDALADNTLPKVKDFVTTPVPAPNKMERLIFTGPFGKWFPEQFCESFISAFRTKGYEQKPFKSQDDLGLTQAEFWCYDSQKILLTPEYVDDPGFFGPLQTCQGGFIGASAKILLYSPTDNSGMGALQMQCNNGTAMESKKIESGGDWGQFSPWQQCPVGTKITGMQAQFQEADTKGSSDDTALNGIVFFCA